RRRARCGSAWTGGWEGGMAMGHLRPSSVFPLIVEGDCITETAHGGTRQLSAGAVLLLPFADQHRFYKGDAKDVVFDPRLIRQGPIEGVWWLDYGGGRARQRLLFAVTGTAQML